MSTKSPSHLSTSLLLSLGTAPLLLFLLGSRALAATTQELGQSSEELFRGDRLPILKMTQMPLDE
jgi:hypothetical protein